MPLNPPPNPNPTLNQKPPDDLTRTQAAWPNVPSQLQKIEAVFAFTLRLLWYYVLIRTLRNLRATLLNFYSSFSWDEALATLHTYWGLGQLLTIARWYVHGLVELGFALRNLSRWPYPKKIVALYILVFFLTLLLSPVPPHSPAPMLGVVFLGGAGSIYLFAHWLQRWAA